MSVQEIAVSHNQHKKLLKAITDKDVLFEDENGDLVVSMAGYSELKINKNSSPIEDIVGDNQLDNDAEFVIFT